MTMSAFDIPIHNKNISTRDFARAEPSTKDAPVHSRERHQAAVLAAAILASCMTMWYALQETLADGVHMASCVHFYAAALLPMLLYHHVLAPSRSKNVWSLLIMHVGTILFTYPYDRAFVSFRLHALVLATSLLVIYTQAPVRHLVQHAIGALASLNSLVNVCLYAQDPAGALSYYNLSFVLLLAAPCCTPCRTSLVSSMLVRRLAFAIRRTWNLLSMIWM